MHTSEKAEYTSTVSRSNKKYHKRIYFNKRSFISMFLSTALLLTSIDCMHVRAEEMAEQVLPALTEETPELENQDTVSGNTLTQEEGTAGQNFVKTEAGAVIITSFVPLNAKESRLQLDKAEGRLSLEEVTKLMPTELKAGATVYVYEDPDTEDGKQPGTETGDGQQPAEGEQPGTETGDGQQPAEEEQPETGTDDGQQPTEGDQSGTETGDNQQPTEGEQPGTETGDGQQPAEGEQPGTETGDDQQPTEGDQPGTEGGEVQQPAEGEQPETGAGEDQPSTEGEQSVAGQEQSGAAESQSEKGGEEPEPNDVAVAESNRTFAAEDGHQWRLLVAAEAGADGADESENSEAKANESESGSDDNAGGGDDISGAESDGNAGDGTTDGEHADDGENSGGAGESGNLEDNTGNGEAGGTGENGNADNGTSDSETGTDEGGNADGNTNNDETGTGDGEAGDGTGAGEDKPVLSTKEVDVEIPVQWVCEDDYENIELTEYTFRPTWDKTAWFYEAGETADSVPIITVSYVDIIKEEVSTQEELAAAFAAGVNKITLKADIALTATLRLPATADIELDGQGHSLLRGKDENEPFIDTMISMDGDDYSEETYGTLTLKSITVDGKTPTDRAGAPAILDCGSLILEEDAVVRDNYNYGTYPSDEEQDAETILDYGGGIQVYGELSVTEESLVTGNFADEFGGGVYLADGATLYLYADVIRENSVSEDAGYGADLYAAGGSTIYYDSSIDMERDGFYLCDGVTLICMQGLDAVKISDESYKQDNVEIFISAAQESGYDDKFLEALKKKLEEDYGYSVIPKMAKVDTSDLREWYAYDHYDTAAECWGTAKDDDGYGKMVPKEWLSKYGDYPRRRYYAYTEPGYYLANLGTDEVPKPATKVYSIDKWLNNAEYKDESGAYHLAQFKEHIYNDHPNMTFVGYGSPANIDFMFYDPQSNGEKIVDFDIDSSQVISHALSGMGFLVNTGVEGGRLHGYLVYYYYRGSRTIPGDKPTMLYVFDLNGVNVENFHGGKCDFKSILQGANPDTELRNRGISIIGSGVPIDSSKWTSEMKIRIQVSPTKIEVRQQPKDATTDIGDADPVSWTVEDKGCNGFGPLMAYTSYGHGCSLASCFTFSNLSMRYTNPIQANNNMLQPIEFADYTQKNTQKYFLNLFGNTDQGYNNEGVEKDLYQEYLKLMQVEGVALITDRETPFEDYLGKSGEAGSNLCEIGKKGDGALSVEDLAYKIHKYIKEQTTTYMQHKLSSDENDGLTNADPKQAVGNIWLESETDGGQVRDELQGDSFGDGGYKIQIKDDIAYYYGGRDNNYTVTYEVTKPNGKTLEVSASAPSFTVGTKYWEWPPGRYTVKQTITGSYGESTVHGYAYFDLKRTVGDNCSHVWGNPVRVEATCTENGSVTRECTICGMPRSEVIPAKGHAKAEWSSNDEEHWKTCEVCLTNYDIAVHQFEEEWEKDENEHWKECNICHAKVGTAHIPEEEWRQDEDKHWKECEVCNGQIGSTIEQHIPEEEWQQDEDEHWKECEVCNAQIASTIEQHIHKAEWSKNDTEHWKECEVCNAQIASTIEEHIPETEWRNNDIAHWHVCKICKKDLDADFHQFGEWITDQEATEEKDGSKYRLCIDCNYKELDSIIRGKITKREDCGENAPQTEISTQLPALALAVLVEDDVHAVGNGTDIEIVLTVEDADNTVSAADKEAVTSMIKSYKLGQYFDVNLYKEMNGGRSQVTETSDEIRLSIEVPEKFRKTARKYAFIRVHNGDAVILKDLDAEDSTVTIDTDRFSTYAFVYADRVKARERSKPDNIEEEPNPEQAEGDYVVTINYQNQKKAVPESQEETDPESQKDSEPRTGETTHFELYATVAFINGASYLYFLFGGRRGMTEETKTELVSRLIRWAKQGGKVRRWLALAVIFLLLVYYHSIGKKVSVEWRQVCGE